MGVRQCRSGTFPWEQLLLCVARARGLRKVCLEVTLPGSVSECSLPASLRCADTSLKDGRQRGGRWEVHRVLQRKSHILAQGHAQTVPQRHLGLAGF